MLVYSSSLLIVVLGRVDPESLEARLSALESAADSNFQTLGRAINDLSERVEELAGQWALEFEQYKAYHESMRAVLANLTHLTEDLRRDQYRFPAVLDDLLQALDENCPLGSYAAPVRSSLMGEDRRWVLCVRGRSDKVDNMVKWEASASDCERLFYGMSRIINATIHVLDVGANIGLCSTLYAAYGFTVVSIEPNEDSADLLDATIEVNGFRSRVNVVRGAAIADGLEEVTLVEPQGNSGGTRRHRARLDGLPTNDRVFKATSVRLTDILPDDGRGLFLKLDCEGCEYEVLAGLGDTLRSGRVQRILFEFSPSLLVQHGPASGPRQLLELLHGSGFNLLRLPFARRHTGDEHPEWVTRDGFEELIEIAENLSMVGMLAVHECINVS
ncbi:hypothetical protein FOZ61_005985 [Perkinsus olseni]|nr:hypothetical protein FOZ61_005985 [Perkinsus olseni]